MKGKGAEVVPPSCNRGQATGAKPFFSGNANRSGGVDDPEGRRKLVLEASHSGNWFPTMTKIPHQPTGYHTATPYLVVNGAARAIEFYRQAFGAQELFKLDTPGGRIGHAEIQIGDSRLMLADEFPEWDAKGPQTIGGTPVSILLYFENADEVFQRALAAGAKELMPLKNQFYGDRSGSLVDPFGHRWTIATHVEDVPPAELERRSAALFGTQA